MAVPHPYKKKLLHFNSCERVIGKPFLASSTFIEKKLVHSLAEHFQILVNKLKKLKCWLYENTQNASRAAQNALAGRTKQNKKGQQLSINLRYCYSSRRATQNTSATRNSPIIGLNLRALPLSAVTVSLRYLPRLLHSMVTCGKTPPTITWSASSKICCHVIVTQQRPIVEHSLPSFATCLCRQGATRVNCKLITTCSQNSEPDSCAVWVSYRQTNCHCKN